MVFFRISLICFLCLSSNIFLAQDISPAYDKITEAALEILNEVKFCVLITNDSSGHPQARTMEPFLPEDNFVIWFGTNSKSRKVNEITHDSRATVYYFDQGNNGYVVLLGHALIINDSIEKENRWKDHWKQFYSDKRTNYTLIKFKADKLEVVSPKHGLSGDSITWRADQLQLPEK